MHFWTDGRARRVRFWLGFGMYLFLAPALLFLRDDCGLIEMINKTSICLKLEAKLQLLGSAHQRMEGDEVGDRELQATTAENKCTRITAMTVQVDLGSLRAASIT